MKIVRYLFCCLLATTVGTASQAFAASSSAKFFFAVFPAFIPHGTTDQTVRVCNATPPPGVSTINSLEIDTPAGLVINRVSPGTLAGGGNVYFVNNLPGIKSGKCANFTLNVTVSTTTCSTGVWNIKANTGNAYPQGDPFTDNHPSDENLVSGIGCSGAVACENVAIPFDFGDGTSGGTRGWNKDGSQCTKVNYSFNVDLANKFAVLQWDTGVQPFAAFDWHVLWAAEDVNPVTGWPYDRRPLLSWNFDANGTPFNIINGVACLSPTPPFPYGVLVGKIDNLPTSTSVVLDTTATINVPPGTKTTLPTAPFPIVINTERMQVTGVASGPGTSVTLTVERAAGGTPIDAHGNEGGSPQTLVMSTPLPIDPNPKLADGTTNNPYYLKQDHMCVWEHGWTAWGINPTTLLPQVRYSTSVFDVGDGWVRIGNF